MTKPIEVYTSVLSMTLSCVNPQYAKSHFALTRGASSARYSETITASWEEWVDLARQILEQDNLNKRLARIDNLDPY